MKGELDPEGKKKCCKKKKLLIKMRALGPDLQQLTSIIISLGLFQLGEFISYRLNTDITIYLFLYMMASTLTVSNLYDGILFY